MSYKYKRIINYYETDRMGIVHHSNYIRFLDFPVIVTGFYAIWHEPFWEFFGIVFEHFSFCEGIYCRFTYAYLTVTDAFVNGDIAFNIDTICAPKTPSPAPEYWQGNAI